MAVTTEINMAIVDCKVATGRDATRIYLGHNKIYELRCWAAANCYYKTDTANVRLEYNGCKVYEVDDNDHVAVA
jgi:hypothetical protein